MTEEDGMPKGDLGRIGLAFAPSDPRIVYALVEAKKSALLRSTDGGATWKSVNTDPDVSPRPFYFGQIAVDPGDPDRALPPGHRLTVSDDAGKTFAELGRARPPPRLSRPLDRPEDPDHIYDGNDGGVGESRDRGETWRFVDNLPLASSTTCAWTTHAPYNVYGGMQDNGSWKGPATVWESSGIRNYHWQEVGFGDGFDTVPDPRDPMRGYAMSQEGTCCAGTCAPASARTSAPPDAAGRRAALQLERRHRHRPLRRPTPSITAASASTSRTDRGDTWTIISPDLTTNNPAWQKQEESGGLTLDATGAENFTTILSIAPEPGAAGRDLGGHRRRPPARHPRRRQELDEPRKERQRRAGEHLDPPRHALAATTPAPPSWSSTTTGAPTGPPTSTAPPTTARPGRAWRPRTSAATPCPSSRIPRTATCSSSAPNSASGSPRTAARAGCSGRTACPPSR